MVVYVLTADTGLRVRIGIVSPGEYACVWDIGRQEVAQPEDVIACGPGLGSMAVEAVDSNDTVRTNGLAENTGYFVVVTQGRLTQPQGQHPRRVSLALEDLTLSLTRALRWRTWRRRHRL